MSFKSCLNMSKKFGVNFSNSFDRQSIIGFKIYLNLSSLITRSLAYCSNLIKLLMQSTAVSYIFFSTLIIMSKKQDTN